MVVHAAVVCAVVAVAAAEAVAVETETKETAFDGVVEHAADADVHEDERADASVDAGSEPKGCLHTDVLSAKWAATGIGN